MGRADKIVQRVGESNDENNNKMDNMVDRTEIPSQGAGLKGEICRRERERIREGAEEEDRNRG